MSDQTNSNGLIPLDVALEQMRGCFDGVKWPTSQTIDGLELRVTCESHPEQYDVYDGDTQVAYFRLRHGYFSADVPSCGGKRVFEAEPNGSGLFDDDERQGFLEAAVKAVREYYAKDNQ